MYKKKIKDSGTDFPLSQQQNSPQENFRFSSHRTRNLSKKFKHRKPEQTSRKSNQLYR